MKTNSKILTIVAIDGTDIRIATNNGGMIRKLNHRGENLLNEIQKEIDATFNEAIIIVKEINSVKHIKIVTDRNLKMRKEYIDDSLLREIQKEIDANVVEI